MMYGANSSSPDVCGTMHAPRRSFRGPHAVPPQFVTSAAVEVCLNTYYIARSVWVGDGVAVPGAIVRMILMAVLALLAIYRGSRPSRWLFTGFQFATAGGALMFASFTFPGGTLTFEPVAFVLFVGYLILGIAASTGWGRNTK